MRIRVTAAPRRAGGLVAVAAFAAMVFAFMAFAAVAVAPSALAQADGPAPDAAAPESVVPDAIEVSPTLSDIVPTEIVPSDSAPSATAPPDVPAAALPAPAPADGPAADAAPPAAGTATESPAQPADASGAGAPAAGTAATDTADTSPPDPATLPRDALALVTASGVHRFTVEIADDPVERARGLMFRTEMAADHGMLFDFGVEGPRSFWMKNTPLPLDIVFAAADGTVVSIARNTTPYSTDGIPSEGDARFVFEVNAGVADAIGLAPGDRLLHRRIAR